MITLSPELRRAIGEAGGKPVPMIDPDTHQTYLVVTSEVYERFGGRSMPRRSILHSLKSMISSRRMIILNKLPIREEPSVLFVGSEQVTIKRYQIAVWISINDERRPFPAVLDTGHSHNLSITESQLMRFAGLKPDEFKVIGTTSLKGVRLRQLQADVRIHRNQPGTMELAEGQFLLTTDEGISLGAEGSSRLPLLGLRALVRSRVRMHLDGQRRTVSLKTPGWFV